MVTTTSPVTITPDLYLHRGAPVLHIQVHPVQLELSGSLGQGLRVPGGLLHAVDVAGDGVQRAAQRYLHIAALASGGSHICVETERENDDTLS